MSDCEFCLADGGEVVFRTEQWRVILFDDPNYPGFCRVIWNEHARELTDLAPLQRQAIMQVVCKVETVLREVMQPHKINLASLGNVTPHVHWHVIPRFADDVHYPQPIWGQAQREPNPAQLAERRARLPLLREVLVKVLSGPANLVGAGNPA
jgi:diadenosine tetraphosphate (Ap4A) HIT family hydrolase